MTRRRDGVLAGLVAAGAALGVAELVAGIVPTRRSPVVAVADGVIRLGPASWERKGIALLGTSDKPVLVVTIVVICFAVGALAGALRSSIPIAVTAAVGAYAAYAERDASWVHAIPPITGALVAAAVLWFVARDDDRTDAPLTQSGADRRRLLLAGSAAGAALATGAGRLLQGRVNAAASRAAVTLPAAKAPLPPPPAGADLHVPGLTPFVTPNDTFYRIDVSLVVPQIEASTWKLRIDGMVDQPLTLTYDDLLRRDLVEADITLMCVSNEIGDGLIGNARWLGVPLKSLLEEAGPRRGADQVVGRAVDGFTTGFPLSVALDGRDALLAVGMNGEPLPLRHGFPARIVVPGLYGYVSATKWLSQIELTRFDRYSPYWIDRGWARLGPIKVGSRIDTPRGRATKGRVPVAGVAWAQHRGIAKVEVRVDDGAWQPARLGDADGTDTWRQWVFDWDATPGSHKLAVRATTLDGEVQTGEEADPFPDGATGWHTVGVRVT